ncbi:MAG: AAA family ATPase, partial [Phenylobacterium sp.]|nr:AAA family ATPase [Phenylobacterium sp.]
MALAPALDLVSPVNDVDIPHPPANVEAEQALLGALLYDNAAFERLGDNLEPRHFYEPFHQRLFAVIQTQIRKGQLAEPILLAEQFSRDPAFEALGGVRYLADLVDRAPPAANAPDYARAIYDLALRRDLIRIGGEITVRAQAPEDAQTAMDQIESAEASLYSLAETGGASQGFISFVDALGGALEMAAEAHRRDGGLAGLSSGLIDLDQKIGGLHPSDLVILAARPSMGKTSLAANIAFHIARHYAWEPQPDGSRKTVSGGVVAFFSLEMSAEQLAMRLLAEVSGVSGDRLRKGEIDASEFARIREAALEIQEAPLHIDATGGLSIAKLA